MSSSSWSLSLRPTVDTRNLCATGPPAFGATTDPEEDAGETIIGYIMTPLSICKALISCRVQSRFQAEYHKRTPHASSTPAVPAKRSSFHWDCGFKHNLAVYKETDICRPFAECIVLPRIPRFWVVWIHCTPMPMGASVPS